MLRVGVAALRAAAHEVKLSDLYAMHFDPVSGRRNFLTIADPDELHQQAEKAHASANDGFVPDLQAEMEKLA